MEWKIDLGNGETMGYDGIGDLPLIGYTALTHLPNGLKVSGDLDLCGCTNLRSLPPKLKVGGYLDLARCAALRSLPKGMEVDKWLRIVGCTALRALPAGLKVKERIYAGGHHQLFIPDSVECDGVGVNIGSKTINDHSEKYYFIRKTEPGRFPNWIYGVDQIRMSEGQSK